MGAHLIEDEFQSDKYPTCPRGKVPLSVKDPTAQDLLWEYAQRRRVVDAEFSDDLERALLLAGYEPPEIRGYGERLARDICNELGIAFDSLSGIRRASVLDQARITVLGLSRVAGAKLLP